MDNPYATPVSTPAEPVRPMAELQRLHGIAVAQRRVLLCVLGYLAIVLGSMSIGNSETKSMILGLVFIAVALAGFVSVIQLANRLKGTITAVVVGILSLIPLIGLLTLLVVNGWASKVLKAAGFRIGLLGASPTEVRKAMEAA